MDAEAIARALRRVAHEIIERNPVLSAVVRIPAAGECLTYALEQSSDLAAWSASSVVPSFTSIGGGMQVVSFAISLNGARQSFRLLVKRG